MRSSAVSGIPARHEHAAERHDAGQRDAVQQAGDVRAAARASARSRRRRARARAPSMRGLVRERRLGVQHALRARRSTPSEEHRGELLAVGPRLGDRRRRRAARRGRRRTTLGSHRVQRIRATSSAPSLVVERRRDRAEPPARAVEHRDLVDGSATATRPRRPARRPRVAQAARDARDRGRERRARPRVVEQRVERRAVPRATRARGTRPRAGCRSVGREHGARLRPAALPAVARRASRPAARSCR